MKAGLTAEELELDMGLDDEEERRSLLEAMAQEAGGALCDHDDAGPAPQHTRISVLGTGVMLWVNIPQC